MPDTTYEYLQGVFNGEYPIQRQNPQPGESEYYYITPNQNPEKSVNELQTTDISFPQQNNKLSLQNIISEASTKSQPKTLARIFPMMYSPRLAI